MRTSKNFIDAAPKRTVGDGIEQQIFGFDPSILMSKASFAQGSVGSTHSHPHAQVTYVESGEFKVKIGEQIQVLAAGEAFYVPPNAVHGAICLQAGALIDVFSPIRDDFLDGNP